MFFGFIWMEKAQAVVDNMPQEELSEADMRAMLEQGGIPDVSLENQKPGTSAVSKLDTVRANTSSEINSNLGALHNAAWWALWPITNTGLALSHSFLRTIGVGLGTLWHIGKKILLTPFQLRKLSKVWSFKDMGTMYRKYAEGMKKTIKRPGDRFGMRREKWRNFRDNHLYKTNPDGTRSINWFEWRWNTKKRLNREAEVVALRQENSELKEKVSSMETQMSSMQGQMTAMQSQLAAALWSKSNTEWADKSRESSDWAPDSSSWVLEWIENEKVSNILKSSATSLGTVFAKLKSKWVLDKIIYTWKGKSTFSSSKKLIKIGAAPDSERFKHMYGKLAVMSDPSENQKMQHMIAHDLSHAMMHDLFKTDDRFNKTVVEFAKNGTFITKLPHHKNYKDEPMEDRAKEDFVEMFALYFQKESYLKEYLKKYNAGEEVIKNDELYKWIANWANGRLKGGESTHKADT